jgi:hypothetical protein
MESEDTRTLKIEIPTCNLIKQAEEPIWTDLTLANGWQTDASLGLNAFWTGTIDLSGYARDMKTFYPQAGIIQQGAFNTERGGEGSIIYTIVSSIPMEPLTVALNLLAGSAQGLLGSLAAAVDQQNWETVLFAETELYVENMNISPNPFGIQQPLMNRQTGSLSPTASDTLYIMKMFLPLGSNQTVVQIPASRVIMPGKFGTEPDVEYMMRLKRSVELSQQA